MGIIRKARNAANLFKDGGIRSILVTLAVQKGLPIPLSSEFVWNSGLQSEVDFWDDYIRTQGSDWPETFALSLDPDSELHARAVDLLPSYDEINVLDVGAGPMTYLGKTVPGKRLNITAIDPLADKYDLLLAKYDVVPPVRTQVLAGEKLSSRFEPQTFDLVFARNCIDHSYAPEKAIVEMVKVLKPGCYALLEHIPNEAENENWAGLHQWNFSSSEAGDFLIGSRAKVLNFTEKYSDICSVSCEVLEENGSSWLITRIRKTEGQI